MTYTRSQLRDLCRRRLGDLDVPYKWSDLQINQWIVDAIADYSVHFPRTITLKIDCTAGTHVYDLPADCHAVLSVEYPKGEDPPEYLTPSNRFAPGFYSSDLLYDIQYSDDAGSPGQLWLSADPLAGEEFNLTYQGDHAYLDDDAGECTVHDRHLELIMLYVRWAAFQELAATESSDPDPTSTAMSTLELNAYRAQRLYLQSLQKAQQAESKSARIEWTMDKWDRSY
jgi:hypothetical protein